MSNEESSLRVNPVRAWWQGLARRERRMISAAALLIGLAVFWLAALAPALRTIRTAPAQIEAAEIQLQAMQRLADEARELRAAPPVSPDQAAAALKAATARLGDKARLTMQGDRAVLTLNGSSSVALRDWLAEARSGARARAVEVNLTRGAGGLTGTVIVGMGAGS